jgi:DNA ligase (NAD+)
MGRKQAQKLVEEAGGTAAQGVTKDLDYLVVGAGGGSGSKLDKAKALQDKGGKIEIISEEEFMKMME